MEHEFRIRYRVMIEGSTVISAEDPYRQNAFFRMVIGNATKTRCS
jgi:hypothetical protein